MRCTLCIASADWTVTIFTRGEIVLISTLRTISRSFRIEKNECKNLLFLSLVETCRDNIQGHPVTPGRRWLTTAELHWLTHHLVWAACQTYTDINCMLVVPIMIRSNLHSLKLDSKLFLAPDEVLPSLISVESPKVRKYAGTEWCDGNTSHCIIEQHDLWRLGSSYF